MENDIDKVLRNIMKKNINISAKTEDAIKNVFEIINKKKAKEKYRNLFLKRVAIIMFCIVGLGGTVFARDIIKHFYDIFRSNHHGVEMAINNEYIECLDIDYVESNGIAIKVDEILMDSMNINLILNMKVQKNDIESIAINDFEIKDENGIVLHSTREENNMILSSVSISDFIEIIDNNILKTSINLKAISKEFPKSKKIYFTINEISLYYKDKEEKINGNWSINFNTPEKFIEREDIEYYSIEQSVADVESAILSNSGFMLKLKLKNLETMEFSYSTIANTIVAIDENGNEYKMRDTVSISQNGLIETTFPISIYDTNSKIKIKYKYRETDNFTEIILIPKTN